ncbi:hypothetical protein AB836_01405 [Rickettsiales bacterium (ex Bugula neritina AB1)]|nr:hypothetical protein AB836_01405 [Rickettsiales bacterium (ex Bugula neritina AB1)]
MFLVLLGLPGAGKGTQSRNIQKNIKINHFAAGDFLRNYSKTNKQIRDIITSGKLIDDETARNLFFKEIDKLKDNVIIDGFPRTISQFDCFIDHFGKDIIDAVIFLDMPEDELIQRILNRWFCEDCQSTYKELYKCCNKYTVKRKDDISIDIIKTRLNNNLKETNSIVKSFQKLIPHKTNIIPANKNIEDVYKSIMLVINKIKK